MTGPVKKTLIYFAVVLLIVTGVACDDKLPVAPVEEHLEAEGMLLTSSGNVLLRVFEGRVDSAVVPRLDIPLGLGDHIIVAFLDHDGDQIPYSALEEGLSFGWDIGDESVLEIVRGEAGHSDGEWEFHFRGLKAGDTDVEFQVLHVGHVDFRTPRVPVRVVEP